MALLTECSSRSLMINFAFRQRLLEFRHTRIGHFGEAEVQMLEPRKPLEMLQTCIGYFGVAEVQTPELFEPLEMLQARIGH